MAKFTANDFADPSFFKALDEAKKDFKEIAAATRALAKDLQKIKGFKEYSEKVKKASQANDQLAKSQKKVLDATKRLAFEQSEAGKKVAKTNEEIRRQRKANKELATSQLQAVKSTNRFGNAIKSFLFKANFLANVMSNLVSLIGRQVVRAFKQAVDTIKNFDKGTARLASVVGKTRDEIADLTEQAKQLGSVTQFTATQVNSLQIELAKLGFTAAEIKAATPGILSFATATGADLAAAAKTAGAAVRVFGLNASETEDAVATLAVATTKSGLTFEHFDTILSTVGPVAKAYGFELADVIALTGELATKGFEANKAATATRNILLNLADANGALAKKLGGAATSFDGLIDGLIAADEAGIDLGEALELTDKRSVAAFATFLEGAASARTLRDGIVGVNDELDIMVKKQLDTLAGDIDLLKSAWEGFILAMSEDGGVFRTVIQFLTNATLQVSNLDLALSKFHKQSAEQLERSFTLLQSLTNRQGAEFQAVLSQYADLTAAQLERSRREIIEQLAEVRKVNKKEAQALFDELVRQRRIQNKAEVQAEQDKQTRIQEDEDKAARLKIAQEEKVAAEVIKIRDDVSKIVAQIKKEEIEGLVEDDEEYVDLYKKAWDAIIESTEGALDNLKSLNDVAFDNNVENLDKLSEAENEAIEKRIEDELKLQQVKTDIANASFDFASTLNDRAFADVEDRLRREVITEEQAANEKNKIRRRQAAINKTQALFNIGINTASAIVEALPNIPLSVAIGILGAIQAATVLATPIPQFAEGIDAAPGGKAWVGEQGRELRIDPGGKMSLTPGKATLTNLKRGTQIVPADITDQILKYTHVANGFEGKADDNTIFMMMDELKGIKQAIKSQPVSSVGISPAGILTATQRGNTTIRKIDDYFK